MREGADVVATYHGRKEAAASVSREIEAQGRRAHIVCLDQTSPASIETAIEETIGAFGHLDLVVNNAAWTTPVPFADLNALTPEIWDRVMTACVRGPFLVSRAAAPHLRQRDEAHIVNIGAVIGLMPAGSNLALSVAKAAVVHLTKCLAVALAPTVRVNCVAPGLVEGTGISSRVPPEYVAAARERAVLKRTTDVNDVANQVVTFCRSDSMTGQTVVVDGGILFH